MAIKTLALAGLLTGGLLLDAVAASAHNGEAETPAHILLDFVTSAAWVAGLLVAILGVFWARALLRGRRR